MPKKIIIQPVENGYFITVDNKYYIAGTAEDMAKQVYEAMGGQCASLMEICTVAPAAAAPVRKRRRRKKPETKND